VVAGVQGSERGPRTGVRSGGEGRRDRVRS
jgi:hypothetical protein